MNKYSCIIQIDNSVNTFPLTINFSASEIDGNFSPPLNSGSVIDAGALLTLTLTPKAIDASASLVWTTGPDNEATITMVFENGGLHGLGNNAELSIGGTSEGRLAYGVSYFYASSGSEAPMARDHINDLGDSPVYVNFRIMFNSFVDQPPVPPSYLPGITNVVMLMLENRSLDHLMGQLYTNAPGDLPANVFPPGSNPEFDGLGVTPTFSNQLNGSTITASPVTGTLDVPSPDPGEGWLNTNQQLFNTTETPPPDETPGMGGFLANYSAQSDVTGPDQIMQFYTSADLPVISTLAKSYAVSDAWFSSVPSETTPNRAFSIAGTSGGYVDNTTDGNAADGLNTVFYKMRTIFNLLSDCGIDDWAIFSPEFNLLYSYNPLTVFLFTQLNDLLSTFSKGSWPFTAESPTAQYNQSIDNFLDLCENGDLPAFSYLEPGFYYDGLIPPQYINGCDYHPPANLCPGEAFLATIYNALTQYKDWNTTLLIVTFDEHGGTFDHAAPPAAIPPDTMTDWSGFGFDRLGLRVPTLLISPTIPAGTVFRSPNSEIPLDHTSFVKTILGWQNINIGGGAMGARAAQAPNFSGVIVPTPEGGQPVNPGAVTVSPNSACKNIEDPLNRPGVADLNGLQKFLLPFVAQGITGSKPGTDEHRQVLSEMQALKTVGDLRDYVVKARAGKTS